MKKLTFIIAALFLAAILPAKAQDISFDSDNNAPYLGVRLGLDISCPTDMHINLGSAHFSAPMFDNGAGFDIGAVYNIPLWKNLYFEPGLSLYYNTMGIDVSYADSEGAIPDGTELSASIRRFGFLIPFQVGYHVDFSQFSLAAFTGPVLTTGIIGRGHASAKYQGIKETESENIYGGDGILNRVDLGWKIGVGATFDRFVLQLSGTIGMCNVLNGADGAKYRDNNVALTLGYNFSL